MRLVVTLAIEKPTLLPFEQAEPLQAAVYHYLARSDQDYARALHDEGFTREEDSKRHFKLFVFSNLRLPRSQRQPIGEAGVLVQPGITEWHVASPLSDFLTHYAQGLLDAKVLRLGNIHLPVREARILPTPDFERDHDTETKLYTAKFICLTPVVASVPVEGRSTAYYLRPDQDADRFSEQVRQNLKKKYALIYGKFPEDDRLSLTFDQEYLARDRHHGTKKIRFKNADHIGVSCPLTLSAGDPELLRLAYDCGIGEKNSMGYGMIEPTLSRRGASR